MNDLSVIICTWNNASRLRITLAAVAQCQVPEGLRWEFVLVNNHCTDDTDAVAAEFTSRLPLRYVHEPTPGISHARNAGLAAATGRLLVFTDDDVRPYPTWLAAYWDAFQRHPEGYYFGGPLESEFEAEPPDEALLRHAPFSVRGLYWGPEEVSHPDLEFIGPNWACTRSALDHVGGFDPQRGLVGGSGRVAVGEETDLMRRLRLAGWMPRYLPQARLRHFVPAAKTTLEHIGARRQAYGYDLGRQGKHQASLDLRFLGIPLGVWKRSGLAWTRYAWARARGEKGYGHYIEGRKMMGMIQGLAEARRAARP